MHKRIKTGILVLAVLIAFSLDAGAAELKIGVVDFQRVVSDSEPGKKFEADLKTEGAQMEAEIEKRQIRTQGPPRKTRARVHGHE